MSRKNTNANLLTTPRKESTNVNPPAYNKKKNKVRNLCEHPRDSALAVWIGCFVVDLELFGEQGAL
jgi:hypothetical protein